MKFINYHQRHYHMLSNKLYLKNIYVKPLTVPFDKGKDSLSFYLKALRHRCLAKFCILRRSINQKPNHTGTIKGFACSVL